MWMASTAAAASIVVMRMIARKKNLTEQYNIKTDGSQKTKHRKPETTLEQRQLTNNFHFLYEPTDQMNECQRDEERKKKKRCRAEEIYLFS